MVGKTQTYLAKESDVKRACYLLDAKDKILGRVAARAAMLLIGKHKAIFTPHVDTGDMVIIVNAAKVRVTGKKLTDKVHQRFSGYPSGQRTVAFGEMLAKKPIKAMELAVKRMLPKNKLGDQIFRKLKIYADDKHTHQAQKPVAWEG